MKLRNKKTGVILEDVKTIDTSLTKIEIWYLDNGVLRIQTEKDYHSFLQNWEDYDKPAEPLIKDEKIRKAVRAWAEANNVPTDVKLYVFEYLGTGVTGIRYVYKAKTLPHERCVQFEYISSDEVYNSQNVRECTITELCGEEEG